MTYTEALFPCIIIEHYIMIKYGKSPIRLLYERNGLVMANEKMINERIRKITDNILEDYKNGRDIDKMDVFSQPDNDAVTDIVKKLLNILFPGYYREKN